MCRILVKGIHCGCSIGTIRALEGGSVTTSLGLHNAVSVWWHAETGVGGRWHAKETRGCSGTPAAIVEVVVTQAANAV